MTEFSIPTKCAECPQLRSLQVLVSRHEEQVDQLMMTTMSENIDTIAGQMADAATAISESGDPLPFQLDRDEIAKQIRTKGSQDIETLQNHTASIKAEMGAHAARCFGVISGSFEANRRQYDVSICGSPKMVDGVTETVTVKRTRI